MHEALVREGYLMPDLKDRIVNSNFLLGVAQDQIWLPKRNKFSLQECVKMPGTEYLLDECVRCLKAKTQQREASKALIAVI